VDVRTRTFTILAQDPAVRGPGGRALTTQVTIPAEHLEPGPRGHRVHVIDYDVGRRRYYRPREGNLAHDPYVGATDLAKLVADPWFHQQNVYAIVMATLGEFEAALGRPVAWGFGSPSHQLKAAPHAFADPNAYYSRDAESLNFGYFTGESGQTVFTCLARDVVAHETAHALLDGLHNFLLYPSHLDQGGFHEGFADIVALLSVLQSTELVEHSLGGLANRRNLISSARLRRQTLADNALLALAEEFGRELRGVRGDALRRSLSLAPSPKYLTDPEFVEPHRRGEILVAAVLNSFLGVWERRLDPLGRDRRLALNRRVVAEEAATAARHLLGIVIRALDYLPPVDMTYPDYLSALLTADHQLYPSDGRYGYRDELIACFVAYGISPAAQASRDGTWKLPGEPTKLTYEGLHFDSLQRDSDTAFRFVWENQRTLGIDPDAFTRVTGLRPCTRVSNRGFVLRETVVQYVQSLHVSAYELKRLGIRKPDGLSGQDQVKLYGGGTLVFDQFGLLKYHIATGVRSEKQSTRLQHLYDSGAFNRDEPRFRSMAQVHRRRMTGRVTPRGEQW